MAEFVRNRFAPMKANEARQIAKDAQTGKLPEIYEGIKRAAEMGDYMTHVYFFIHPKDKKTLEDDGYKITDVSDRNETCINISWKED